MPSRDLIGLRAAGARIAHMSGAEEQIDQIYRDEEDTTVMACDGSTGDLSSTHVPLPLVVTPLVDPNPKFKFIVVQF